MRCIVVVPWVNGAEQSATVYTVCREWNQNELSHVTQPHKKGRINYLIHTETQDIYNVNYYKTEAQNGTINEAMWQHIQPCGLCSINVFLFCTNMQPVHKDQIEGRPSCYLKSHSPCPDNKIFYIIQNDATFKYPMNQWIKIPVWSGRHMLRFKYVIK